MLILDTETTDLLKTEVADLATQPHLIEIGVVKLDDNYKEVNVLHTLVQPGIPINEEEHARITKLTNADLANAPTFLELYGELTEFFIGERVLIAHNLPFDHGVLLSELRRIGKEFAFPWPPIQICTVERTMHLKGKRLKLVDLYELSLRKKLKQTHRAIDDAMALVEVVRKLKVGP